MLVHLYLENHWSASNGILIRVVFKIQMILTNSLLSCSLVCMLTACGAMCRLGDCLTLQVGYLIIPNYRPGVVKSFQIFWRLYLRRNDKFMVGDKMLEALVIFYGIYFPCSKIIITRICCSSASCTVIEKEFSKEPNIFQHNRILNL